MRRDSSEALGTVLKGRGAVCSMGSLVEGALETPT